MAIRQTSALGHMPLSHRHASLVRYVPIADVHLGGRLVFLTSLGNLIGRQHRCARSEPAGHEIDDGPRFRSPMFRWPGKTKPDQVSNEIVSHLDKLPTLLVIAGDHLQELRFGHVHPKRLVTFRGNSGKQSPHLW